MVHNNTARFGGYRHGSSGDIMFLIYYVASLGHVIKR